MKSFKTLIGVCLSLFILSGCKKENPQEKINTQINVVQEESKKTYLKKEFSKALAHVISKSPELRFIIKKEALKQFDNDYDVLYQEIKNKQLEEGASLETKLLQYLKNKDVLSQIDNEIPALTIFVPALPEEFFSAEKWNTQNEIPMVGVSLIESNNIPIYDSNGYEFVMKSDQIPAFPVLVVKESERVIFSNGKSNGAKGREFQSSSGKVFQFLDSSFDGQLKNANNSSKIYIGENGISQKVRDSYDIYASIDGWHRDYIYYGITPGIPTGEFSYEHKETITEFSMNGNAMAAYNKIADQTGDPTMINPTYNVNSGWTGGNFEFKVTVLFNAKNGLGNIYETYFPALPTELFSIAYTTHNGPVPYYTISSVSTKPMSPNLQLFKWDLNQYASSIKIDIEEVDQTETIIQTETRSAKFASNFAIDGGILKKIGLKFGASLETTNTSTFSRSFTLGNDQLGSVIIDFADKVIVNKVYAGSFAGGWWYITQDYPTGYFKLSLDPVKVQ